MSKRSVIAVVEDDQAFRESLERLLKSMGYAVAAFPSATDFIAYPHRGEIACLIADVHMPVMTGDALYQYLTNAGQAIPTILVTAYPDEAVRARALNDGVICYLLKPLDENELVRCLRPAVDPGKSPEERP